MCVRYKMRYDGIYDESRTGRMENGQVPYVKTSLLYRSGSDRFTAGLPDGTHVNLYFDENDVVIAGENADEIDAIIESRVVLSVAAMGTMIVVLITFTMIAKKNVWKTMVSLDTNNKREKLRTSLKLESWLNSGI